MGDYTKSTRVEEMDEDKRPRRREIVACGGGMTVDQNLILYCCSLVSSSQKDSPIKICFLPTASGDMEERIEEFYSEIGQIDQYSLDVSHVLLIRPHLQPPIGQNTETNADHYTVEEAAQTLLKRQQDQKDNLRRRLVDQDIIFVGGGNTANMLAIWRVHGVEELLREAYQKGVVLCGTSAGAVCWFSPGSITDSYGELNVLEDGMNLVPFRCNPHYLSLSRKVTG